MAIGILFLQTVPSAQAEPHQAVADKAVEFEDAAKFEETFPKLDPEKLSDHQGAHIMEEGGLVIFGALGGAASLATRRLTKPDFYLDLLVETKAKADVSPRMTLKTTRLAMAGKVANYGALAAGIYFIVEGSTGIVIAMNNNKPVYTGNLPALAKYLTSPKAIKRDPANELDAARDLETLANAIDTPMK